MPKITFMRHAQAEHNNRVYIEDDDLYDYLKKTDAHIDSLLTPIGIKQCHSSRQQISKINYNKIYTSPLTRCLDTLTLTYFKAKDMKVIVTDALIEHPHTDIINKRLEKKHIERFFPKQWNYENVSLTNPYFDEKIEDEIVLSKFITNLIATLEPQDNVLIVTHTNCIQCYFKLFHKKEIKLKNCQTITIEV